MLDEKKLPTSFLVQILWSYSPQCFLDLEKTVIPRKCTSSGNINLLVSMSKNEASILACDK